MTFSEKIDEWIKEAETRPGSALMILKLIAGRMRDLAERNEELLAENISLQDGSRVQEYQKRIAHLEFQLELLKRRFGSDETAPAENLPETSPLSLLVYTIEGRILRLSLTPQALSTPTLGHLSAEMAADGESPRLLAVPAHEEVLLLFSSGRVSTWKVSEIPETPLGGSWSWDQAIVPDDPHAGEVLVCLMPLSRLPVSDFFLQASRRGCVKKTMSSIFEKVLSTHYLGRGAIQKSDQAFEVTFGGKKARFVLVTHEGRLLALEADDLTFTAEERIRLNGQDHLVAAFVLNAGDSLVCLTQTGKLIQREAANLEISKSPAARGLGLISPNRLEQGTRFIGAVACQPADRLVVLDGQGNLSLHLAGEVCGAGSIHGEHGFVSLGLVPSAVGKGAGS